LTTLPFDYTKGGRLKTATNGIGGTVSFTYDEVDVGNYGDEYDQDYSTWCNTNWCSVPSYAFWKAQNSARWEIKLDPKGKKALYFLPKTSPTVSYLYWKVDPYTPGANYVMTNTLVGAGPDCSDTGNPCSANDSVVQRIANPLFYLQGDHPQFFGTSLGSSSVAMTQRSASSHKGCRTLRSTAPAI